MPRKRTTKAVKSRPKAKLPDGDEGAELTEKERKAKLKVFLKDFDAKVEAQKLKMQKDLKNLLSFANRKFSQEIVSLPPAVKKMTLQEFIDCGGTLNAAIQSVESQGRPPLPVCDDLSSTVLSSRTLSRINPNFTICDTIMEEEDTSTRTKKNDSVLTSTTKSRKVSRLNGSVIMPPPAAPSSSFKSSRYQTPQHGRSLAAAGWETPLITPKFDPRLPLTPAQKRDANPGEILMSLGGSPVHNPVDRGAKGETKTRGARGETISVRGKTITLNLDNFADIENVQIPDSTELENLEFKSQISTVMEVLSDILKKQQNGNL